MDSVATTAADMAAEMVETAASAVDATVEEGTETMETVGETVETVGESVESAGEAARDGAEGSVGAMAAKMEEAQKDASDAVESVATRSGGGVGGGDKGESMKLAVAAAGGFVVAMALVLAAVYVPRAMGKAEVPEFAGADAIAALKRGLEPGQGAARSMGIDLRAPKDLASEDDEAAELFRGGVVDSENLEWGAKRGILGTKWSAYKHTLLRNCSVSRAGEDAKTYVYRSAVSGLEVDDAVSNLGHIRFVRALVRGLSGGRVPSLLKSPTLTRAAVLALSFVAPVDVSKGVWLTNAVGTDWRFENDLTVRGGGQIVDSVLRDVDVEGRLASGCRRKLRVIRSVVERLTAGALTASKLVLDQGTKLVDIVVEPSDGSGDGGDAMIDGKGAGGAAGGVRLRKCSVRGGSSVTGLSVKGSFEVKKMDVVNAAVEAVAVFGAAMVDALSVKKSRVSDLSFEMGVVMRDVSLQDASVSGVLLSDAASFQGMLSVSKSTLGLVVFGGAMQADSVQIFSSSLDGVLLKSGARVLGPRTVFKDVKLARLAVGGAPLLIERGSKLSGVELDDVVLQDGGGIGVIGSTLSGVTLRNVVMEKEAKAAVKLSGSSMKKIALEDLEIGTNGVLALDQTVVKGGTLKNATIDGYALFEAAKMTDVEIVDVTFGDMADFESAVLKKVRFTNVVFEDLAIFEGAKMVDVVFDGVVFRKPVKARDAKLKRVEFVNTTFPEDGGFTRAY